MNPKAKYRDAENGSEVQSSSRRDPIAIIGIGCRYPGISGPAEFWQTLIEGKEAVGPYPGGRFAELDRLYAEAHREPGRLLTDRGGFLEDVAGFDSEFFEISPREAVYVDPQHRLLLEVALEALDDAGQIRETYVGSAGGVYTGLWTNEYEARLYESGTERDFYSVTGCGRAAAPARLSFVFGLEGPSLSVDTACSSSLAAVHLACQALWAGEIDIALAGGANVILGLEISELFTQAGILSPDGRCKFGDASADGFVRSEGAGIVVLKRLSQAVADKDPIYAVIRGSAMNNDGRTSGLMTPSIEAQEQMMLTAWKSADIDPKDILYIETHGTGTGIGDRVEIRAVTRALEKNGVSKPCWLGSVKTNIGHAEAAAGVAGLIKGALTAKHRRIAPSLHFNVPNPKIAWDKVPVRVAKESVDLSAEPGPILVGVSSFGLSGTNVHVVLEEAAAEPAKTSQGIGPYMLPISAKTPEALHAMLGAHLAAMQAAGQEYPVRDVCYTASARRNHYEYRAAIVGEDLKELEKNLTAAVANEDCDGVIFGRKNPDKDKIVFVAPGQGSQWLGMAKELFDHDPIFRQAFEQCDAAIAAETGWRLVDRVLGANAERYLSQIDVIQPALFTMSVALAAVWRGWGIEPDAVVGHSMGEVAAAHIAGILNLEDAAAIICRRSRLMKALNSAGGMATVELPLHEVEALLQSRKDISVGASNGPNTTVISGDSKAIEALLKKLEAKEVYCRQIKVDVASHSAQVDPILDDLLRELSGIRPQPAKIPMLSTVTGKCATNSMKAGVVMDAAYWVENLRHSVLFAPAIEKLSSDGYGTFIELSPHPILLPSIEASAREVNPRALAVASLRREKPARATMLCGLAELYTAGHKIAWERIYPEDVRCVRLPQYQFQRKRYWPKPGDPVRVHSAGMRIAQESDADAVEPLYVLEWVEEKLQEKAEATVALLPGMASENWLIFADDTGADDTGIAEAMKMSLTSAGGRCTLVRPGSGFKKIAESEFEISPSEEEDLDRLFKEIAAGTGAPTAIVHLWSLDNNSTTYKAEGLIRSQAIGSLQIPGLARAITAANWQNPPRLWLITAGAMTVGGGDGLPRIESAPMWGIGGVVALEKAELRTTLVDLSFAPDPKEAHALAFQICVGGKEDRIALRGDTKFVARLARASSANFEMPATRQTKISAEKDNPDRRQLFFDDATYLITGGLGGVALTVAEWMAKNGAGHLVLLSRRAPSAESVEAIRRMEEAGATVVTVRADVTRKTDLAEALKTIREDMPPLKGIMHTAAVVDDALITDLSPERFLPVMAPKITGTWNLHAATLEENLDFFVLFSSVAALLPQPGMGSYAAANAFLDSFAHYRRALGKPAASINWGAWDQIGLARGTGMGQSVEAYQREGMRAFSGEEALDLLHRILENNPVQVMTLPIDLNRFAEFRGPDDIPPLFTDLIAQTSSKAAAHANRSEIPDQLAAAGSEKQRQEILEAHLQELLGRVLKLATNKIDRERPLGSMGLDSLLGLEFVRRLSKALQIAVPATVVFNYPTIKLLAAHLLRRMQLTTLEEPAVVEKSTSLRTLNIEEEATGPLSEEDALHILMGNEQRKP